MRGCWHAAGAGSAAAKAPRKVSWLGQLRQKHEQKLALACQQRRSQADPSGELGPLCAPPACQLCSALCWQGLEWYGPCTNSRRISSCVL